MGVREAAMSCTMSRSDHDRRLSYNVMALAFVPCSGGPQQNTCTGHNHCKLMEIYNNLL